MSFFNFNLFNRRKRNCNVNYSPITRAARATVEELEQRQLLTTTVEFTGFSPPAIDEGQAATFTLIR
jgi:hypothetical protein